MSLYIQCCVTLMIRLLWRCIMMLWSWCIVLKFYNGVLRHHLSSWNSIPPLAFFLFNYLFSLKVNPFPNMISNLFFLTYPYYSHIFLVQIPSWLTLGCWFVDYNLYLRQTFWTLKNGFHDLSCYSKWNNIYIFTPGMETLLKSTRLL